MLFLTPFYYFDRMDLARPSLFAAAAIGLAIATRWKARTYRWFWIAIAMVVALHVYAVLSVEWVEGLWASGYFIGTVALVDYGLILAFVKLIEVICKPTEAAESHRREPLQ
jgi:hypothetical protein